MEDLSEKVSNLRKKYREIFMKTSEAVQTRINEIRPDGFNGDILDKFENGSTGEGWQKTVLDMFENDIATEIYRKWNGLLKYRENFHCKGCATCCNLACSEFSPEELEKRAANGDNFAKQFTGVFIPYGSREEAKKIYPEYLKMLENLKDGEVYFYHCPKLTECKKCSDYENRPQICRAFPDNPLDILPESCGFYEWRQEVEPVALMLHSMVEIIDYYKKQILCHSEFQNQIHKEQ